jgi:3-hydroxy-9,10-secoandrosta-1,3,5(10)-triene-9,17-dione monooxygenase
METRLRYKRNSALANKLCVEAVDSLHEMAGRNGIYDSTAAAHVPRRARGGGPLQLQHRCAVHALGALPLGGEFKSPTLLTGDGEW